MMCSFKWEQEFKPSKLKSSIFFKSMCKCEIEDKLLSSVTLPVPYYGNYCATFQVSVITKTVLSFPTSISSRTIVSLNKDRWKVSNPKKTCIGETLFHACTTEKTQAPFPRPNLYTQGQREREMEYVCWSYQLAPFSMEILLCKWAGKEAGTIIVQYLSLMFLRPCFHFRWNGAESLPNVAGWP